MLRKVLKKNLPKEMLHPALYLIRPIFINNKDLIHSLTQPFLSVYLGFDYIMVNSFYTYKYLPLITLSGVAVIFLNIPFNQQCCSPVVKML